MKNSGGSDRKYESSIKDEMIGYEIQHMNDYERQMNKASVQKEFSMFRRDKEYFYAVILISIVASEATKLHRIAITIPGGCFIYKW